MKMLPKVIGDFKAKNEISIEELEEKVKDRIKALDVDTFLRNMNSGRTAIDDITLVYYDYLDGGIGSTSIFLAVEEDEEGQFFEYGICSELDGRCEFSDNIPLERTDELFEIFFDVLMINTKEFKHAYI